jgi:galactitol-specific phosphotransferase system IIC component
MPPPTPYRFVNALLLGVLVAVLAVMVKGFLIGLEQTDAGWGWLSVPIDTIAAPLLLVSDVLMLQSRQFDKLVVLPWAMWGLLIGTMLGFFNDRD